jgi:SAM-dependent methyltransferase
MSSVRALSFGEIAGAYELFRPGYPQELFDVVEAYARRPVRTALEIGAGTGKATRLFAGRGVAVTATEPDAAMLAELRKTVPADVRTLQAAFEEVGEVGGAAGAGAGAGARDAGPGAECVTGPFGLVYAAAALHWTRPQGRWERVAALLEPGGVFASFGGPFRLADPALEEAVRAARAPFLERDDVASPDGTAPDAAMQWPGTELRRCALFEDVRQCVLGRRLTVSAGEYVGYLSTVSAYLQLPRAARREVYDAIARVLPGRVEVAADIIVHLARRCPGGAAGARGALAV